MITKTMVVKEKTWLGLLLLLRLLLRRSQCLAPNSQENDSPNLESAMVGFDPFVANAYEQVDAGFKNIIFEPTEDFFVSTLNTYALPNEVSNYSTCAFQFASTVLTNFSHYQSERHRHIFTTQDETDDKNHTPNEGNAEDVSSGGLEEDTTEKIIREFFLATNGEIVQNKINCVVLELTVPPFSRPVFTADFTVALQTLQLAANNSDPEYRKNVYRKFVDMYGTHYMKKSRMGAEMIFQKMFTEKEMDEKPKQARQNCLKNLAQRVVTSGARSLEYLVHDFFEISETCNNFSGEIEYFQNNGIRSSRAIIRGPPPLGLLEEWSTAVQKSPVPLSFELEKLSSLFLRTRTEKSLLSTGEGSNLCEHKNDIQIYNLLESAYSEYCQASGGNDCSPEMVSFGENSGCPPGFKCKKVSGHSDALDAYECKSDYIGGVIVAGGTIGSGASSRLSDVETIKTLQLPHLPVAVSSHTLSQVGYKLFSCGGFSSTGSTDACHTLDLSSHTLVWESSLNLPERMFGHAAVTIGSHIWFTSFNKLYDFSTEEQLFSSYNLPMKVSVSHCVVSNGTHSYMIGVGERRNEIWVNKHSSSPEEWLLVARLGAMLDGHGCLWFKDNVIIAGGSRSRSTSNYVELFNTETNTFTATGPLLQARGELGMFVLDGEPAVVGGEDGRFRVLATIETFDVTANAWRANDRKLLIARSYFGLVQLR